MNFSDEFFNWQKLSVWCNQGNCNTIKVNLVALHTTYYAHIHCSTIGISTFWAASIIMVSVKFFRCCEVCLHACIQCCEVFNICEVYFLAVKFYRCCEVYLCAYSIILQLQICEVFNICEVCFLAMKFYRC